MKQIYQATAAVVLLALAVQAAAWLLAPHLPLLLALLFAAVLLRLILSRHL